MRNDGFSIKVKLFFVFNLIINVLVAAGVIAAVYWVITHPSDIGAWFHSLTSAAEGKQS